jgi:hypothetical protein
MRTSRVPTIEGNAIADRVSVNNGWVKRIVIFKTGWCLEQRITLSMLVTFPVGVSREIVIVTANPRKDAGRLQRSG